MAANTQTQPGQIITLTVGSAAIYQARFVTFGSGNLAQTAAGGAPIGISNKFANSTDTYDATEECSVLLGGIVKLEASAAISKGAKIKAAANGKAVTAGSTDISYAIALEAASTDGDYINVLWTGGVNPLVGTDISFLDLSDTPSAYTADYYVTVNATGDALELSAS